MGDKNQPHTLGDYSRPNNDSYRNTIELPKRDNVVPLRSDTIRLVQNGCALHGLQFEDPYQHLKDFLKLVDSLDLTTRHAIDHLAGGKLRDKSAKKSGELIEDLALYDNESWNEPREFAKPVKAIALPQDVPSTSEHHLVKLENQVQSLMEAHLSPKPAVQVNKIAFSSGGLVSNVMASQDAQLSMFKADFKQQQSEMTNNIDAFFKAINDLMTGSLPSDMVKNLKLNVNSTSLVFSAHSYPMEDPQSFFNPFNFDNAIMTCFNSTNSFQKDQPQIKTLTVNEIGTPKSKDTEKALEDEFKYLHLNLPVHEVLAHAPMYNALLDKYVESLELGKNGSAFIQSKIPKKMKDHG
nr:MAK10-like protein [Tanacetum cinerariifolium]